MLLPVSLVIATKPNLKYNFTENSIVKKAFRVINGTSI